MTTIKEPLFEKGFYNRKSNSAAFCAIQLMSFKPPLSFYSSQMITSFLIQRSQPKPINGRDFGQS